MTLGGPSGTRGGQVEPDLVQRSIGSLGRWHWYVCLAIFAVKFPVAWHQLSAIFLAPTIDFRCSLNTTSRCSGGCPEHVFDRSIFAETITTQWDLVCERAWLADMAQALVMGGILVGNVLFGYLADRFGRRTPLIWAVVIQLIAGVGAAFSPWFALFVVLRFLCALATGGTMVTSFVLVMEIVGSKYRTTLGLLYQIPFNLAHLLLAVFSYMLRDWRHLQMILSFPSILFLSYYFFLPESPRWLLAVGRREQATKEMEKIAEHNGLPFERIKEDVDKYFESETTEERKGGNFLDLVRTRNMTVKTVCICFNWIVCGLCFFGVAQFLGQVAGNIFINVALSAVMGLPGMLVLFYTLQTWGRRWTLIVSNLVTGVSCLLIVFVPKGTMWATTSLGCLGMLGMSMAFPTVYIYSGELYPTRVRNLGVGTCSMAARLGSMVSPFVARLTTVQPMLPPVIFGVVPLLGALLCIWLPETLDCKLPDTVEEAEALGKTSAMNGANNNSFLTDTEFADRQIDR